MIGAEESLPIRVRQGPLVPIHQYRSRLGQRQRTAAERTRSDLADQLGREVVTVVQHSGDNLRESLALVGIQNPCSGGRGGGLGSGQDDTSLPAQSVKEQGSDTARVSLDG